MKMNFDNKNVNFLLFATLLVFFVIFYVSCDKHTKDYRNKWVGTYECEKIHSKVQMVTIDVTTKGDSILYMIESKSDEYSLYMECNVKVNSDGSFYVVYDETTSPGERIYGNFRGDSLFVYYDVLSPGTSYRFMYKGKKLKTK